MAGANTTHDVAYSRENENLTRFKAIVDAESENQNPEFINALKEFSKDYERLLADTKLLTSVGDRLQRKLKQSNMLMKEQAEEIKRINGDLQQNNVELKLTIDELTKAKASRKAQTYLFIVTIVLFFVSELIEDYLASFTTNWFTAWLPKIVLLLILKPLESYLESRLVRQAMDQEKRMLLDKHTSENVKPTT